MNIQEFIEKEENKYEDTAKLLKNYAEKVSKAYVRWLSDNFWTPWNENEWYSEYEMNHITDEELFNKFLEEYETK